MLDFVFFSGLVYETTTSYEKAFYVTGSSMVGAALCALGLKCIGRKESFLGKNGDPYEECDIILCE